MNFVCIVFEQGDEILTLLSMVKQMVECNPLTSASSALRNQGPPVFIFYLFIFFVLFCFYRKSLWTLQSPVDAQIRLKKLTIVSEKVKVFGLRRTICEILPRSN